MNILVIGLGSMGKRRIRILKKHFNIDMICGIDQNPTRRKECEELNNIKTFDSLPSALEMADFDVVFICTSPLSHSKLISKCLSLKMNVFCEINLISDGYIDNIKLAQNNGLKLFLSSSLLYRDEIKYIQEIILHKPVCYSYHVGQYLKDWHPWEKYTNYFISDERTNGCREILSIELPWIIKTFSEIVKIDVQKFKLSSLDINYNDCIMMLVQHENGTHGSIVVDVVAREAIRELRIVNENLYIEWRGTPESLKVKSDPDMILKQVELYDSVEQLGDYNKTIVENEYINEMRQFFGELEGIAESVYTFNDDLNTIELIQKIEA